MVNQDLTYRTALQDSVQKLSSRAAKRKPKVRMLLTASKTERSVGGFSLGSIARPANRDDEEGLLAAALADLEREQQGLSTASTRGTRSSALCVV